MARDKGYARMHRTMLAIARREQIADADTMLKELTGEHVEQKNPLEGEMLLLVRGLGKVEYETLFRIAYARAVATEEFEGIIIRMIRAGKAEPWQDPKTGVMYIRRTDGTDKPSE